MQPHQQRVVDEKAKLDIKIETLRIFMKSNPLYNKLDADEKVRLGSQLTAMSVYSDILGERIAAFK